MLRLSLRGCGVRPWLSTSSNGGVGRKTAISSGSSRQFTRPQVRQASSKPPPYNAPIGSDEMPTYSGITTMMRLPYQHMNSSGLDACFVGVPLDQGTSNRPGTRFGPREIRAESSFLRGYNLATGAAPFESLQVADVGDVWMHPYELPKAVEDIRQGFSKLIGTGCKTLALGGDHTITYPILQAVRDKYGPVGLIQVDAHDDTAESLTDSTICHATTFKRAGDEGCLDFDRVTQIGLRSTGYGPDDYAYGESKGFRMVMAYECWYKSLAPLMEEVRAQMGDKPVYLTFDIDALDPSFAPGTGTPEIGGLTTIQALEIIRGCRGLNIVGCDLVEVSPAYDPTRNTSLVAGNLLFEMLCVLPGVTYKK